MAELDPMKMSDDEVAIAFQQALGGVPEASGTPAVAEQVPPEPSEPVATAQEAEPTVGDGAEPSGNAEPPNEPVATAQDELMARIARLEQENQRIRSESGRTKSLAIENRRLREQLKRLEGQPAVPRPQASSAPAPQPVNAPAHTVPDLTDEERIALGDDAARVLSGRLGALDAALEDKEARLQAAISRLEALQEHDYGRRHDEMMDSIERHFGTGIWEAAESEAYQSWGKERNPFAGRTNAELINAMDDAADTAGMVALLEDFQRRTGWSAPGTPGTPAPSPTPSQATVRSANVAAMPATSQAATAPSSLPSQAPKVAWTPTKIDAVYQRAERDPAWAQSREGRSMLEAVQEAVLAQGMPAYW